MDNAPGTAPPVYDARLELCGDTFFLTRSLGLLKRLEQRFGALGVLAERLGVYAVTQSDLARICEEVIRGTPEAPTRDHIERWLFEAGTHATSRALQTLLMELVIGNARLRALHDEKRVAAEERGETDPR